MHYIPKVHRLHYCRFTKHKKNRPNFIQMVIRAKLNNYAHMNHNCKTRTPPIVCNCTKVFARKRKPIYTTPRTHNNIHKICSLRNFARIYYSTIYALHELMPRYKLILCTIMLGAGTTIYTESAINDEIRSLSCWFTVSVLAICLIRMR